MFRSQDHRQGATLSLLKSLFKTSYRLLSLYNPGSVAACLYWADVSLIICVQNSSNVNTLDIFTILLTIYLINIIYITDMLS